jgi:hypothetical protein
MSIWADYGKNSAEQVFRLMFTFLEVDEQTSAHHGNGGNRSNRDRCSWKVLWFSDGENNGF